MTREESAAKAIFDIRDDAFDDDEWEEIGSTDRELYECQSQAALAAADAHDAAHGIHRLVIDDATVERAARALDAELSKTILPSLMDVTRAVLAAAVEAGQ